MTPYEELVRDHKALIRLVNDIVEWFVPPDDELSTTERLLIIRLEEHYRSKSRSLKVGGIRYA